MSEFQSELTKEEKQKLRDETNKERDVIMKQWTAFATGPGKKAVEDLFSYLDQNRNMYIKYGEERMMPGPDGKKYPIDNHSIAAYLQGSRVCGMVKTYIQNQIG